MGKSKKKSKSRQRSQYLSESDSSSESSKKKHHKSHKNIKKEKVKKEKEKEKEKLKDKKDKKDHRKQKRNSKKSRSRSRDSNKKSASKSEEKEKPSFVPSGILAKYSNSNVGGIVLKFTLPADARSPQSNEQWKLFPFKEDLQLEPYNLKGQSAFLIGRDARICDIILDNPSVSQQHAVIQFRQRSKTVDGNIILTILPYLMDLETTNGTFLNTQKIEGARYYELRDKDLIQFGQSSRDFVLIKIENNSIIE